MSLCSLCDGSMIVIEPEIELIVIFKPVQAVEILSGLHVLNIFGHLCIQVNVRVDVQ